MACLPLRCGTWPSASLWPETASGRSPCSSYKTAEGVTFTFASEIKALLQDPQVPSEVDDVALYHYLTYGYVPAPLTAFKGFESSRLDYHVRLGWRWY